MRSSQLVNFWKNSKPFQSLADSPALAGKAETAGVTTSLRCPAESRSLLACALRQQLAENRLLIYVTPSGRAAEQVFQSLSQLEEGVAIFPAWETLPHERLSPRADTMAARVAVLRRLRHPDPTIENAVPIRILVAPVRALLQSVIAGLAEIKPLRLRPGQDYPPEQVLSELLELGYERTDLVGQRGQVAVRGGILDVFVPGEEYPQRIEFFGDQIDEIRYFSLSDQRTVAPCPDGIWAPACKELRLTKEIQENAARLVTKLPGVAELLELASQGIAAEGLESLSRVLCPEQETVFSLLPAQTVVCWDDPDRIWRRATDLLETSAEFETAAWSAAAAGGKIPVRTTSPFQSLSQLFADSESQGFTNYLLTELPSQDLSISDLATSDLSLAESSEVVSISQTEDPTPTLSRSTGETGAAPFPPAPQIDLGWKNFRQTGGSVDDALAELRGYVCEGWRILITCLGIGAAQRIATNLQEAELPVNLYAQLEEEASANIEIKPAVVTVVNSAPIGSLVDRDQKLVILPDRLLTGRAGQVDYRTKRKVKSNRRIKVVDPLALRPGDFVVHETHGVGRFVELTQRVMKRGAGANRDTYTREYIVLEYASSKRGQPGDRLFIPTDSMGMISRYSGSDTPTLNKIGGSDWAKTKAKARAATRKIAAELIRIYAARQATEGHAFSPDTPWQRELEDAFIYNETPDQLVTIDEIKADMEKPVPMDRLLCGDVGYGKTEVAVRAAFKAIQDGKQVAVLVPTTLLVNQHFETFADRFAPFPIKIGQLSRFSSPAQAKKVKAGLESGQIDLVIGTHTLLSGTIGFKDLGLVVIDEEQRFGVEHKETLKAIRTNVDVLAMSATPIPRTLEMAVTGIRELSTLSTPPEDRHPVLTFVGPYQNQQVKAAIKRELLRDGQVFFVHNRVETCNKRAAEIQELIPQARVAVAHGRMSEKQLEQVMVDFWNHEFDVLVCTTIIETGLDIANANTLIVDGAHKMGLSQLHQLRGRVGRSRERGYAYFFYPADRPLTQTAHERMTTIATNTDLGSGVAIAQKDLEIRGAGNLLGGEQSGHIAGVGFDLYVRMVAQAVREFRKATKSDRLPEISDPFAESDEPTELRIDLPVAGHIPPEYIASDRLRLEIYQKLSAALNAQQQADLRAELQDRYGPLPPAVELLFRLARLREQAQGLGLQEIVTQGKYIRFGPIELPQSQVLRLKRVHPGSVIKAAVRQVLVPVPKGERLGSTSLQDDELLDWVGEVLSYVLRPISVDQ